MRPDHLLDIARRKTGRPTAVVRAWECIPFDGPTVGVRLTLADDVESYPNREDVLIDKREEREEEERFERETGQCHVCGGDGQEWRGWSRAEGHRWARCRLCAGMGHAPAHPADHGGALAKCGKP